MQNKKKPQIFWKIADGKISQKGNSGPSDAKLFLVKVWSSNLLNQTLRSPITVLSVSWSY